MTEDVKEILTLVGVIGFVIIFLVLLFGGWTSVPAGHYGVKDTFGNVDEIVLSSGFHLKSPITSIKKFEGRTQKFILDNVEGSDKFGQLIYADIVVNYKVTDKQSARFIYVNIGSHKEYQEILALEQKAQEGFKQATVVYEALEILSKREEVKNLAKENILRIFPQDYLEVQTITITDIRYTQSFNEAIQRKKDAEQLALASENEVKIKVAEAKKNIAEAEGEKQVSILKAEAEAKALEIQRKAIADSPELLELRRIERDREAIAQWNGALPTQMIPNTALPFINVGTIN